MTHHSTLSEHITRFTIINNIGTEDRAQSQAFIDTWTWDDIAIEGYQEILDNKDGRFTRQTIELIKGLNNILGKGSLLTYLVSLTLRITEIHCDPTASHYLKLVCDGVFVPNGGDFITELIWNYSWGIRTDKRWNRKHDVLLCYSKGKEFTFNAYEVLEPRTLSKSSQNRLRYAGALIEKKSKTGSKEYALPSDVWYIPTINGMAKERLGYPTQKPEALLQKIIKASTNEGDIVLDTYCGCGTTIAVAQELRRKWVGIDITYQSIALVLKRFEASFGKSALSKIILDGIPQDMESARALAHKKDDRVRKEFEKWAAMTYTGNRAIINQKKGADSGIDGVAYFRTNNTDNAKIILQVKSGNVKRNDIATLRGDMQREEASMAVFITLEPPTVPMINEAKAAGFYHHDLMDRNYDAIQIVTIEDMIEHGKVLDIPMSHEVLKEAQLKAAGNQLSLLDD
ncbi:MAG: DNA methyltransferase [Dehalococcoidales bacterium]|nr:DNA methyltransferase [Dehalococcoidales bacterium]